MSTRRAALAGVPLLLVVLGGCAASPQADVRDDARAVLAAANDEDADAVRTAVDDLLATLREQVGSEELTDAEAKPLRDAAIAVRESVDELEVEPTPSAEPTLEESPTREPVEEPSPEPTQEPEPTAEPTPEPEPSPTEQPDEPEPDEDEPDEQEPDEQEPDEAEPSAPAETVPSPPVVATPPAAGAPRPSPSARTA